MSLGTLKNKSKNIKTLLDIIHHQSMWIEFIELEKIILFYLSPHPGAARRAGMGLALEWGEITFNLRQSSIVYYLLCKGKKLPIGHYLPPLFTDNS